MRKLVVISHTEHQKNQEGEIFGWGPTINELNQLSNHWQQIVHIACLENKYPSGSSIQYVANKIKFVPIPIFGGKYLWNKLDILWKIPNIIYKIRKEVKNASHVQLRLPMGIGIFLLIYFWFRKKNKYIFWVKYANNWAAKNIPWSNKLQRTFLKNNIGHCKVTINGFWENQPKHCFSFENPCLNEKDLMEGQNISIKKNYQVPFNIIFVGSLVHAKGIDIFIESLAYLDSNQINNFHIVGDGNMKEALLNALNQSMINYTYHGPLSQKELHQLLAVSHFIFLPSRSEGFPKVLAEAMCFGCIPISTNVGSISHYINDAENGFIIEKIDAKSCVEKINMVFMLGSVQLFHIAELGKKTAALFTFEAYYKKLKNNIIN